MTKAKSKPCATCAYWDGGCSKGHKPRFFRDGGLRRVCDDFAYFLSDKPTVKRSIVQMWVDSFMKIFGFRRA